MPARELLRDERNWRVHSDGQRSALRELFDRVGFVGAVVARELPEGGLMLVDGELRSDEMGEQLVPVLVTDLSEREAAEVLATYDPIASLAEANGERLNALLREFDSAGPSTSALLAELADAAGLYKTDEPAPEEPGKRDVEFEATEEDAGDKPLPETFELVVTCKDESDQQQLFERLKGEGYKCRVLTL